MLCANCNPMAYRFGLCNIFVDKGIAMRGLGQPTRTYATMDVSKAVFDEVKQKLLDAGYDHAILNNGKTLDMNGIALEVPTEPESPDINKQIVDYAKKLNW
jgi:histidinol phosphatase-like PHP family hydrolase